MQDLQTQLRIRAKIKLAREWFFGYCNLKAPDFYKNDRNYLKVLCNTLQGFLVGEKKVLLVDMPPRHGKSRTLQLFVEWVLGHNQQLKVMTGSYNNMLSTTFAKNVRNSIQEIHIDDSKPVYSDIFPGVQIKQGDGAMNMWSLEGGYNNYLATSPKGTATGFGANLIIIDDLVKNAYEAHNEAILNEHFEWFCFTGDTEIATSTGNKRISDLLVGDKVLTFDHFQYIIKEQTVVKINSRLSNIYKLEFSNGRSVKCTGNHKFYTNKGYLSIEEILCYMRCPVEEGKTILLDEMQSQSKRRNWNKNGLLKLRKSNSVRQKKQTDEILFFGMPTPVQSESCRGSICGVGKTPRCLEEKTQKVPALRQDRKPASTSYRPRYKKQLDRQPNSSLPIVPYTLSQVTRVSSSDLRRVYDIEVAETHNFFANGMLVHNCNTMLSRLEEGGKIIVVMTRWATADFAGRILEHYGDNVEHINMKAIQDDGSMLCEEILSKESCEEKKKAMGVDIFNANYQQEPIDIKGRLYGSFKTYDGELPRFKYIKSYTDTADTGADFLCSLVYGVTHGNEAYILDALYTDEAMEVTEPQTAELFYNNEVNIAVIESNNGGRGFARNVERILREKFKSNKTIIRWFTQHNNKISRILSASAWCVEHIYFPAGWHNRWPVLYEALMKYQRQGKNEHDDAPDVISGIYEDLTGKQPIRFNTANLQNPYL